jgi:hypothetical protein
MHNNLVRNAIIFSIVVLYVIAARNGLVSTLFSIWVGAWAMGKLFKPFFGPHQGFEDLTVDNLFHITHIGLGSLVCYSSLQENKLSLC